MSDSKKLEEKEIIKKKFKEYKENRDLNLRDELIKEHLYIAEIIAKKFVNKGIDYDDLYQVACLGLINAVDRFDVDKGYEFSSFATPTIVGEIKRYFRDKGWTIRVTRRIQELSKDVNEASAYLSQNLQGVPTVKDIADYLNVSEEDVLEAIEASKVYSPQSIDREFEVEDDESDFSLKDLLGSDDYNYTNIEIQDILSDVLSNFTSLEKQIIARRIYYKETQLKIATELSVSHMTVSRVEKRFMKKIKENYEKYN